MSEKNTGKLSFLTIASYAMSYGSGYQIMGSLVGSYFMIFMTDVFGISAAAIGVIMVLASIWDAVNDPMMGVIADNTKTRFGKYRPYFLWVPFLLTVVVVLMFSNPNLSQRGKVIWTAVFYVCYGMLRTAIEIPCNALINAVSDKESERSKMISAYTLVMGIFTTITTSFALTAVSFFGKENTSKGYMIVVGFAGILMTVSCLVCFFNTKETYVIKTPEISLKQQLSTLFRVKAVVPAICIWLAGYVGYNIMMGSSVYYIMYCVCRPDLIPVYMLIISVSGLLGIMILIPLFTRLFKSTRRGFIISQVGALAFDLLCILFSKNVTALFIMSGLASAFATMFMVYGSMVMTEVSDMVYYKTSSIMNGVIASLKGFTNKCGIAISNGIIAGVLASTGYIANAIGQEPQATITGITMVRFMCPAVLCALIVISLVFYPITDEVKKVLRGLYSKDISKEL